MNNKGFSLAELSIVLIIIGLIIAGISSGSKIIEQNKIRSIISDVDKYKIAVSTFKLTYS